MNKFQRLKNTPLDAIVSFVYLEGKATIHYKFFNKGYKTLSIVKRKTFEYKAREELEEAFHMYHYAYHNNKLVFEGTKNSSLLKTIDSLNLDMTNSKIEQLFLAMTMDLENAPGPVTGLEFGVPGWTQEEYLPLLKKIIIAYSK